MKHLPLLLLALLLTASACKKEATELDKLPAATSTGQNTGGCLIDGQAFVATGLPSGGLLGPNAIPPLTGGFAFDSLYMLELYGQRNGENVTLTLFLRARTVGKQLLNQSTRYYPQGSPQYILNHAVFAADKGGGEVYVTDALHTGEIVLTLANKPFSAGTFEFTAASTFDRTKTITVTNGRFDRKQ
ncbi:DUF6252 family protein [Hymenobacter elongatus]|uniref:Uncharacterized protein n=1 Tax=Hymenobacter elongatus TaxID=877208 RepID=A0A4Z0PNU9_9BACT|nr:DUF6252 family protein [Hymenobacter elongatus]TGE17841.1 hypothetical protein E5J99_06535 [Hymenobacter elongatus]